MIFCFPIVLLMVIEGVILPLSTFTFRPYEALLYIHEGVGMPYYPKHELSMVSEGDLCYSTEYAIKGNEKWKTDDIGYRNDNYIKDPDILIIGDSFIAGNTLTQDSTITNLLSKKINDSMKVYNLAPADFSDFKVLYTNNIIRKPKLIILAAGERELPAGIINNEYKKLFKNNQLKVLVDKITRLYSIEYLKSRIFNKRYNPAQSSVNSKMFFFKGINQKYNYGNLDPTVDKIISCKNYCDSIGIDFLFMPIPNKETMYYEQVPFECQPDFIFQLTNKLIERDVRVFNVLNIFNDYRKFNNELLYNLDDTHWNSNGVNLIAEKLAREITAAK